MAQGRLIDHLRNSQSVGLEDLQLLVMDEADRLLEMGFSEEVQPLPVSSPPHARNSRHPCSAHFSSSAISPSVAVHNWQHASLGAAYTKACGISIGLSGSLSTDPGGAIIVF